MSPEKIIHDLRTPLARAKTITKILLEEYPNDKEYMPILIESLEEMEKEIQRLQTYLEGF